MFAMIKLVLCLLIIVVLISGTIKIVPESQNWVVERLGRFDRILRPGIRICIPILDNIVNKVSLKEHVHDFEPQPVITKDNVNLLIDSVVYCKTMDAQKITYQIQNPVDAIDKLTSTNLRAIVSTLNFDEVQSQRDIINSKLLEIVDKITDPWGIDITRIEIQSVKPSQAIAQALETQKQAEMEKKATILKAEATRQQLMTEAEGKKDAMMLEAEAKAKSIEMVANAEAEAIKKINEQNPSDSYVRLQAIKAMEKINLSDASKVVVPTDISALSAGIVTAKDIR